MRVSTVFLCSTILAFSLGTAASTARERASETPAVQMRIPVVHYRTENIAGTDIFYREAGPADAPTLVLMHGFPTSSHMFRNLIPLLADRYHVIAPDYPGFGESAAPDHDKFEYTFGHISDLMDGLLQKKSVKRYVLYAMDYGAPISYRLAVLHPERVSGLIIQNGNAYDEGLKLLATDFLPQFAAAVADRKGDILVAQNKLAEARAAYVAALAAMEKKNPGRQLVQVKLESIGGTAETPKAAS